MLRRVVDTRCAVTALAVALGASLAGCRKDAPATVDAGASLAGGAATDGSSAGGRDAKPQADLRRDAGLDPACAGAELALLVAAADERCSVSEREYALLVADGGVAPNGAGLRQEARRDGDEIVFSLVNGSSDALLVPLRFHPGERARVFSVIAEDRERVLYELAPPSVVDVVGDAGAQAPPRRTRVLAYDGGVGRVRSARIELPPGGRASARVVIDPRVVARIHPPCGAEAGACAPAQLPRGSYTLHIGQLLAAIDTGPPARVEWDRP